MKRLPFQKTLQKNSQNDLAVVSREKEKQAVSVQEAVRSQAKGAVSFGSLHTCINESTSRKHLTLT